MDDQPPVDETVAEALRSLAALDTLPVTEHPRVLEQAHARLRACLDGTG